jgi:hypothetical protein
MLNLVFDVKKQKTIRIKIQKGSFIIGTSFFL